ncbi:uncharacterized protein EI97DRAFT_429576 [Westerdykella ornata]|uniref:Pre-mRNA-splicing factor cwc26 n=1 Tax=Westerdykella ornata TaxID=318751 RepID=A0A6A6JZQ2_WESOR|nr:uncharacterized protein EI97DRAFT_429576 [Westerdykella ornata]KAF2281563.1 hypothetical protein EI97DRAFT_429576 [Westerdykella ornata]
MSDLASYLAKNYLTADTEKKSKKRKRKNKDLIIDDDDDLSVLKTHASSDDEDAPMIVGSTANIPLSSLKKSKKNKKEWKDPSAPTQTWTTVGVAAPSTAQQIAADQAAADAIIASAAAERKRAEEAEDEAPEMVDTEGVLRMESGARAGLQSAAQVAAQEKAKADEEARKAAAAAKEGPGETIYRDASGRIINVAMKRAEARRKAEEEERKKRELERAARGDVQNAEAARRRDELKDAKGLTVARYADDVELNEELKERDRWNDPAMGFIKKKKEGRSVTGKPLYQGAFPPNRYNIRPGHRWDGVDRSNGFEREWFKSRNRRADVERLEYAWQMDE